MQAPPLHGPEPVRVGGEQTAREPSVAAASAQFHGTTSTLMLLGMAHSCICATKDGVVVGTQSAPTPKPKLSISWPFSGPILGWRAPRAGLQDSACREPSTAPGSPGRLPENTPWRAYGGPTDTPARGRSRERRSRQRDQHVQRHPGCCKEDVGQGLCAGQGWARGTWWPNPEVMMGHPGDG